MYAVTRSDPSHNKAIRCTKVIVLCRPQFDNSLDDVQSGKTHITVRLHECPTSLILARRVETSLTQGVKGRFWSCPAGRDVRMLVYRRVRYGVGILFQGCSYFDRTSITGGPLMGARISIGYPPPDRASKICIKFKPTSLQKVIKWFIAKIAT